VENGTTRGDSGTVYGSIDTLTIESIQILNSLLTNSVGTHIGSRTRLMNWEGKRVTTSTKLVGAANVVIDTDIRGLTTSANTQTTTLALAGLLSDIIGNGTRQK